MVLLRLRVRPIGERYWFEGGWGIFFLEKMSFLLVVIKLDPLEMTSLRGIFRVGRVKMSFLVVVVKLDLLEMMSLRGGFRLGRETDSLVRESEGRVIESFLLTWLVTVLELTWTGRMLVEGDETGMGWGEEVIMGMGFFFWWSLGKDSVEKRS